MGSKNHEIVPTPLITQISGLRGGSGVHKCISSLAKVNLIAKVKNAKCKSALPSRLYDIPPPAAKLTTHQMTDIALRTAAWTTSPCTHISNAKPYIPLATKSASVKNPTSSSLLHPLASSTCLRSIAWAVFPSAPSKPTATICATATRGHGCT